MEPEDEILFKNVWMEKNQDLLDEIVDVWIKCNALPTDEKHDFLKIENISAYPQNQIFIYSRIGQLVYETTGYNNLINNFNGTSNQGNLEELPEGTYYYVLNLNGESKASGFFVIQR